MKTRSIQSTALPIVWDATKDITQQDIVLMNYRRLQAEHAVRQALKKEKK